MAREEVRAAPQPARSGEERTREPFFSIKDGMREMRSNCQDRDLRLIKKQTFLARKTVRQQNKSPMSF